MKHFRNARRGQRNITVMEYARKLIMITPSHTPQFFHQPKPPFEHYRFSTTLRLLTMDPNSQIELERWDIYTRHLSSEDKNSIFSAMQSMPYGLQYWSVQEVVDACGNLGNLNGDIRIVDGRTCVNTLMSADARRSFVDFWGSSSFPKQTTVEEMVNYLRDSPSTRSGPWISTSLLGGGRKGAQERTRVRGAGLPSEVCRRIDTLQGTGSRSEVGQR